MWRICNNALPTMVNLHWRDIVPNANCALCKDHPEDSLHAVWACEVISGVWNTLDWFHQSVPAQPSSFNNLLSKFLFCHEEFRAEIFVTIVWFLWNRRNAIHFGCPALLIQSICSRARSCKSFLKPSQRSPLHPVLLLCSSGAPLNLSVLR